MVFNACLCHLERKKTIIDLLKPLVLRRLKRDVLTDLPNKSELMIYHDLSKLQKELYKAILTKNRCKTPLKTDSEEQDVRIIRALLSHIWYQ